ncbi:MAG TPA: FecR domain-containing protein [Polyangiaceae bacterium]|jgi:hypothetical protein|nr:FecR domain-containing protein [Polyangiaceae bacterium]
MTAKGCARAWQAEAVLDGVLSRADASSFERHVAICSECAGERQALLRLGAVARRLPSLDVSPLRRRALHNELLRRANELSTGVAPKRFARLWVVVPVVVCALAALCAVWLRPLHPTASVAPPTYRLSAGANARWRVADAGRSLKLELQTGVITIVVNKLESGQRFAVALPDGELEVRGTRFTVECDAHHTRRITVAEGRVAVRLRGQAALSLGAGEAWSREATRAMVAPGPASSVAVETARSEAVPREPASKSSRAVERGASGTAVKPSAAVLARNRAPSAPASSASERAAPVEAAPSPAASAAREFAEAMAVFSRGDFGTAERLFAAFEARYPRSPHVEDMLFLKALGRSRRGDVSGARSLALEYLRRFPGGFRSVEAQRLAAPRAGLAANPGLVTFP